MSDQSDVVDLAAWVARRSIPESAGIQPSDIHRGFDESFGWQRSVMAGAIFDGVAPWNTEELMRTRVTRPQLNNAPSPQRRKHPAAFMFYGNQIRRNGSLTQYRAEHVSRWSVYQHELQSYSTPWPRAVDWRAPELRADSCETLQEVSR